MNFMNIIANICGKLSLILFITLISCALLYGFSAVCGTIAMILIGGIVVVTAFCLIVRVCCYKKNKNNNADNFTDNDAFYCIAGKIIANNTTERKSK